MVSTSSAGVGVRMLLKNVPTTCGAEEMYDALRCHNGGRELLNTVLIPTSPDQSLTCALADYSTESSANAAMAAEFWVDGERCQFQKVGNAVLDRADQPPKPPDAVIEISGLRPGVSHLDVFNAFRRYADIVNVYLGPRGDTARVLLRPEGEHALRDAINKGIVLQGISLVPLSVIQRRYNASNATSSVPPQQVPSMYMAHQPYRRTQPSALPSSGPPPPPLTQSQLK